jgi:hypothetical protein
MQFVVALLIIRNNLYSSKCDFLETSLCIRYDTIIGN